MPDISVRLGRAVILQAMQDLVRPTACHGDQINSSMKSARKFLLEDDPEWKASLQSWCKIANLSEEAVRVRAKAVFDQKIDLARLESDHELETPTL